MTWRASSKNFIRVSAGLLASAFLFQGDNANSFVNVLLQKKRSTYTQETQFEWLGGYTTGDIGWGVDIPPGWNASDVDGQVNNPTGLAVDSTNGYFYVADNNNNRIDKFNLSTGNFVGAVGALSFSTGTCPSSGNATTWCTGGSFTGGYYGSGGGDEMFTNPSAVAVDPAGGYLYVADSGNNRIAKLNLSTGAVVGSIGATGNDFITTTTQYNNPQTLSVAAWFKTTTTLGGEIIGFSDTQEGFSNNYDRMLYMEPSGVLAWGVNSSAGAQIVQSTSSYNDGIWHHAVGTFTANSEILYVDGVQVASTTTNVSSAQSYAGYWRIGFYENYWGWPSGPNTQYMNVTLDDVAVWSSVLSAGDVATIFASASALGASSPQWSNVVAAWHFNEASGTSYADASGNGNTALAVGTVNDNVAGKYSGAVNLPAPTSVSAWQAHLGGVAGTGDGEFSNPTGLAIDTTNGYLYVADNGNNRIEKFNLSTGAFIGSIGGYGGAGPNYISTTTQYTGPTAFSLSAWFKTFTNQGGEIIGFTDTQSGSAGSWDRHIYLSPGGNLVFGVFPGTEVTIQSTTTYNDNNWHHVAGTFTPNSLILYVDGAQVAVATSGVPYAQSYNGYWRMGYYENGWPNGPNGHYMVGLIDDVGVWSTVLSASNVSTIYSSGSALSASSPQWANIVAAWHFNEASGTSYADASGNGNTANAQGTVIDNVTGKFAGAISLSEPMPSTGWQTSLVGSAGAGDSEFQSPNQVAVDPSSGFLYVADSGNNRVEKFNASTGAFVGSIGYSSSSTGTCPTGAAASSWCTGGAFMPASTDGTFTNPQGLLIDHANGYLYVVDENNNRIEKLTLSTGAFIGADGELYSTTGTCPANGPASGWCTGGTFAAGTGDGMFDLPVAIAEDTSGVIYVTDSFNGRIEKLTASSGSSTGTVGAGVILATNGWIQTTGSQESIWGPYDGMISDIENIDVDNVNGYFYLGDDDNGRVQKYSLVTGEFVGAIGGGLAGSTGTCPSSGTAPGWCTGGNFNSGGGDGVFSYPYVAVDAVNGYLYVMDSGNCALSKFTASTGAFIGSVGETNASIGTCPASGVTTGWCTGGSFTCDSIDGSFNWPTDIRIDTTHGFLYVAQNSNPRIDKFNLATGIFVGSIGETSASSGTCPASGVATSWCTGGTFKQDVIDGSFNSPIGMAVDPTDNLLYVVDYGLSRISKHTLSTGAQIGALGQTNASTGTCPSSGAATGWCTGGAFGAGSVDGALNSPSSNLVLDFNNNRFYVGDTGNNRMSAYTLSTGAFVGAIGGLIASTGTCPGSGITTTWCTGGTFTSGSKDGMFSYLQGPGFDTAGNLYIADEGNERVVRFLVPEPSLTLGPQAALQAGAAIQMVASSGTPPYKFSIVSGKGWINSRSGKFVAPSTAGTTVLQVKDSVAATAQATITTTVSSLAISPTTETMHTLQPETFSGSGGVLPYTYSVTSGGGSVTQNGVYTAPAGSGSAVVTVTDHVNSTATANITIGTTPMIITASGNFTVPPGITSVKVFLVGAGGGGGGSGNCYGGGGGGSGYATYQTIAVTPGQVIPITIGAGGGGNYGPGYAGGPTYFGSYAIAPGGSGGTDGGNGGYNNANGGIGGFGANLGGNYNNNAGVATYNYGLFAGSMGNGAAGAAGQSVAPADQCTAIAAGEYGGGGGGGYTTVQLASSGWYSCNGGAGGQGYGAGGGGASEGCYSGNGGNGASGYAAISW